MTAGPPAPLPDRHPPPALNRSPVFNSIGTTVMSKIYRPAWDRQGAGRETLAVRAGQERGPEREHTEPIFTTSSFVFDDAAQAAMLFGEQAEGNIYSRFTNPTVRTFENRLGMLEGAAYCIATASGMAAISGLVLSQLKPGDHVVVARGVFGSTLSLFNKVFARFGIDMDTVPVQDTDGWRCAIRDNTRMLFLETPTNPLCHIADIAALAEIAHDNDALLVVDNCFCTPALQRPLSLGADVIVHTATKYLDGQGRCVGGAMATNNADVHDGFFGMMRTTGPSMSPFNAWVFLKGLETLQLRMERHSVNAIALARWLREHPAVEQVFHPGLEDHPGHALAARQQDGFGGIVSFRIRGGRPQAWSVIDATRMISITANLGDAKTTITHPASTTHARITQAERDQAGISENLIRVSAGLENVEDIQRDIARGLDSLAAAG
jgi:O-succinylhomoserine sulfhydrylase